MSPLPVRLEIVAVLPSERKKFSESLPVTMLIGELIRQLLQVCGLPENDQRWGLAYQDTFLDAERTLGDYFPHALDPVEVEFRLRPTPHGPTPPLEQEDDLGASSVEMPDASVDMEDLMEESPVQPRRRAARREESSLSPEALSSQRPSPARDAAASPTRATSRSRTEPPKPVSRRATVRYYNRMNPERVYPLLVLITRDRIETVEKQDTEQTSSQPFQVKTDLPVEIEPVLPGCDCYPPKVVARMQGGELQARFRVVPRVLGTVDGATVTIRQDHDLLAEVPLDVSVSQRLWMILSGLLTFLIPGVSAVLKHFGIDFTPESEQGFSLYLSITRVFFDWISPLMLTLCLGIATGLVWWFTRASVREVFWDVKKIGPDEQLADLRTRMKENPTAVRQELATFLEVYPEHQSARLMLADLEYSAEEYESALASYQGVFGQSTAEVRHYLRASLAASKLKQHKTALHILQEAERVLPAHQLTGVMLYNTGCYHTRLGQHELALSYLRRALAAGYTNESSYRNDPDLSALRSRAVFQQLLAEFFSIEFECPDCEEMLKVERALVGKRIPCSSCKRIVRVPAS